MSRAGFLVDTSAFIRPPKRAAILGLSVRDSSAFIGRSSSDFCPRCSFAVIRSAWPSR